MSDRRIIRFVVPGVPIADGRPRGRIQWPSKADFARAFIKHRSPDAFFQWLTTHAFVQVYSVGKTRPWRDKIAEIAREARASGATWECPVRAHFHFALPRPTSHYSKAMGKSGKLTKAAPRGGHFKKPDLDNLVKAAMDGVTQSELWKDDALVCDGRWTKTFVQEDRHPGLLVELHHLTEDSNG